MATIRIQNFGPIQDTGIVSLSTVLLVIGRQSAGKSTFMKVLCFCRWLEKHIMTSPKKDVISWYTHNKRFMKDLMQFHRINDIYFKADTKIVYDGEVVIIEFPGRNMNAQIVRKKAGLEGRYNTKLCYLPAERNLVSAIRNVDKAYKTTERDALFNFILEWNEAKEKYDAQNKLHLSMTVNTCYYNSDSADLVALPNGDSIPVFFASSGVQSVIPIDVMSNYLSDIVGTTATFSKSELSNAILEILNQSKEVTVDEKTVAEEVAYKMKNRMVYKSMQLFVEEPEQNLYPDAQRELILNLVRAVKRAIIKGDRPSMLVLTTHSPYVLTTLNVLMADANAWEKKPDDGRLSNLVDKTTLLPLSDYSAFFIDNNGVFVDIKHEELPMFSGVELDGVSDWVNEHVCALNDVIYGEG